jgi:RHS repeat-associated protein
MKKIKLLLTLIGCLAISFNSWAGKEKMNARINAGSISVGNFVAVTDNKYPNVKLSNTAFIKSSIARVSLALDNTMSNLNYLGNTSTYLRVGVKITHTDANGNLFTQIQELTINNKAVGLTTDKGSVIIKNAHSVIVRILYFRKANGVIITSPLIPSNSYIEAEIETERYYAFNALSLPTLNHFYYPTSNELEVYWNSVQGAEEYELEYTYVNDIAPSSQSYSYNPNSNAVTPSVITPIAPSSLAFTFNNNATRIRTTKNNFKISLNYNRGMIVYRLRTIGKISTLGGIDMYSDWTLPQTQSQLSLTLPPSFNDYYVISAGHEENKNWQATTTFAEDGKKKDVIGYFDGSNKKRQTVTRTNTENISLIGETMYDSQGRPAITALPSPASNYSSELKFFENFNQSATQPVVAGLHVPYSRLDFEAPAGGSCPVPASGMFTGLPSTNANGASVYYSANNQNKQSQNAYIPDAQNYPFTHAIYAPDNTAKVRYQSGVGLEHRIGNGRETKNIEGDPEQEDLDKLFGSEAGYVEKYKKTMTVDANGQISVSYLNTEGKVVSTALAGNAPSNVNQLGNLNVYPKSSTYLDYHLGNYTSVNVAANGSLTYKKKILPDITGTYNFLYDVTVPQYTDNCIPNFCYDCGYNLDIQLTDECGAIIYSQTTNVGAIAGSVDFTCNAPIYFSSTGFTPAFSSVLTAGKEYFITKILTIDNTVMDTYLNHYMDTLNNGCVKSLHYFDSLELANIDYTDCNLSCAACSTKVETFYLAHSNAALGLPTSPTYDPNYIYMSLAEKKQAIDKCEKPCKPATLCQTEFQTMLQDFRPQGQYAQYKVLPSGIYTGNAYDLSIFNTTNYLRISTIFGYAPAASAGVPFLTSPNDYNMSAVASWTAPEYYNEAAHNFSSPTAGITKYHYFDNNGQASKIRLVLLPGGIYYPNVTNNTAQTSTTSIGIYTDNIGEYTFPENLANIKDFVFAYGNNPQWAYSLVKYHPEINYFLDCDRQSNPIFYNPPAAPYTSEQYDIDLRGATTMAEALGTVPSGINFGNSKWTLVLDNTTLDLLNNDPYFKPGAPGAGLYAAFANRLTTYQGSGTTIKQVCAQMYSSAQMYYAPPSCTAAATFGSNSIVCSSVTYVIPTASLDRMWQSYREIYITEKQRLISEMANSLACNPGSGQNNYYNGAIGDPNFNPWNAYSSYNFFPFQIPFLSFGVGPFTGLTSIIYNNPSLWPNYGAGNYGAIFGSFNIFHPPFGNGYFDFGSPSSQFHAPRYANKVRRVPDTQTASNALAGGASDPNDIMNNLSQTADAEIYASTGQCPLYIRLQLFLQHITKKGTLFNFGTITPLVSEPAFSQQLYDGISACGGLAPTNWNPLGFMPTLTGNVLTITFYDMSPATPTALPNSSITLTNLSGVTISNWNDIKLFKNINFNGTTSGGVNTFNIKAMYNPFPSTAPYQNLNFAGTTCLASSCASLATLVNNQTCVPTTQAFQLQSFFSAVVSDYNITSIVKPINLGDYGQNNSSSFFSTLVRAPFTSAVVSVAPGAISHSVSVTNFGTSSIINLMGKDAASQNINVSFVFTPSLATGPQDLTGVLYFSNLQVNQNPSLPHDIVLKAHYNSAGGATQLFKVQVNYPAGLCGNSLANTCQFYNLKKCTPFIPASCKNNTSYQTSIQIEALLNEMFTYPINSTVPGANLVSFNSVLQAQYGVYFTAPTFNTFVSNSPSTVSPGFTDYTLLLNSNSNFNCMITLSATSNVLPASFNAQGLVFSNLTALSAPSNSFSVLATDGVNNYTFTGVAPCFTFDNCIKCGVVKFNENFESYILGTPVSALNFLTNKFDVALNNPATPCNFVNNTCFWSPGIVNVYSPVSSPAANIGLTGDYAIRTNFNCGFSRYLNHTPLGNKYLNAYVNHPQSYTSVLPSAFIIPYKLKIPIAVTPGKKYEVSFYFRTSNGDDHYTLKSIVNDGSGSGDLALNTELVNVPATIGQFNGQWNLVKGTFIPNGTTLDFKVKISSIQFSGTPALMGGFSIDDVVISEVCETDITPPIPPEPIEDDCVNQLTNIALANAQQQYNAYINTIKKTFKENYTNTCYKSLERLGASYQSSEGHYTLYYYDQGGNLIKTVPPEGVEPINLAAIEPISGLTYDAKIKSDRDNKTKTVFTNHRMVTRYEYNSLNQLVRQQMPDHANTDLYTTTPVNSLPPSFQATAMDFANANQGYLIGSSGAGTSLFVTNNAGVSWTPASGLTTANIIDIDYVGSTAYAIVSDGTILKSTTYNTASPIWQSISLPTSNTMQFTDIQFYSSTEGYICGKNGLLLKTSDAGVTWTTINLGTLTNFNKLDFQNDGAGMYGVLVGDNGSVLYITPTNLSANLWTPYSFLGSSIDVLNASIINTGNGSTSYLNVIISGIDKAIVPNRGTLINMIDMNGLTAISNLYLNSNSLYSSKVNALATKVYNVGLSGVIDVYFGGVENTPSPTSVLKKLQFTTTSGVFNAIPLAASGAAIAGVNDLVIRNLSGTYDVLGVSQNGNYINVSSTANTIVGSNLNTVGASINTAPCNRIAIDPSNNQIGLIAGNTGALLQYNNSSSLVSQLQTAFTFPTNLTAVTAAKDGSGKVYAVGGNGNVLYSSNNGSTWQLLNLGMGSGVNLTAALYVPSSPAKVVFAGSSSGNSYVAEYNTISNILSTSVLVSSATYKSIATPYGATSPVFLAGDNGGSASIHTYPLGNISSLIPLSLSGGLGLNKIAFYSSGLSYAVGNGGTIFKSLNNGSSYSAVLTSGTSANLNDVSITDTYNALAYGASSTIIKTTDGGITWLPKNAPATSNIQVVYNFGNGNVLAAGNGSSNLFTINDQSGDYSTRFFYDALGRLIISQNAKQFNKLVKAYSYTIYDAIGRINQVGEIAGTSLTDPMVLAGNLNGIIPIAAYNTWLTAGTKTEVTSTIYDNAVTTNPCGFIQDNLRKRVSATYIDTDDNLSNGYTHASYYTYDIHGNVKTLLQENPAMPVGHTCKLLNYDYDLISGKVNSVAYQAGEPDAFFHKYEYDADNRITNVFTSKDGVDYQQDAKYFYYLHGPLARTELGNDKVQGMDYAYTIQGWIKGVNSVANTITNDIGKDGAPGTAYNAGVNNLSSYISYDAAGYALNYFAYTNGASFINDYKAIEPTKNTTTNRFDGDISTHPHFTATNSLFNGNIMAMATSIYTQQPSALSAAAAPQLATYKYDQLNRINLMQSTQSIAANAWNNAGASNNYRNEFTYDANGNILNQKRYNNTNSLIDNMSYQYHIDGAGKKQSNRLYHVNDVVANGVATTDIDDQGAFTPAPAAGIALGQINALNNYAYDEIGNLIKDKQEGISSIDWTVYGKIKSIARTATSTALPLVFKYDAAGNRISKETQATGALYPEITYYVRDAQGNVMATYSYKESLFLATPLSYLALSMNLLEHPIYGSSRLGMRTYNTLDNVTGSTSPYYTATSSYSMALQGGNVSYELSNHLGNVLSVVSDRKLPIALVGSPNTVDHYVADLLSSTDYAAFGAPMPGRQFNNGNYRYGFNGKENDNEVKGAGNQQDYGLRIYDNRLGKFLSVDPLTKSYPELTPYQFANNKPIESIDLDGGEDKSNKISNQPSMEGQALVLLVNSAKTAASAVITMGTAIGIPVVNAVNRIARGDIEEGSGRTKPVFANKVYKLDESWAVVPIKGVDPGPDGDVTFEAGKEIMKATVDINLMFLKIPPYVKIPVNAGVKKMIDILPNNDNKKTEGTAPNTQPTLLSSPTSGTTPVPESTKPIVTNKKEKPKEKVKAVELPKDKM